MFTALSVIIARVHGAVCRPSDAVFSGLTPSMCYHMTTDYPTESLTGRQGWEWSRLQSSQTDGQSSHIDNRASRTDGQSSRTDNQRPGRQTRNSTEQSVSTGYGGRSQEHSVASRREIQELEAALERKEQQLQCVIEQYERLLDEKNRKLAACKTSSEREQQTIVDLLTERL